MAPPPTLVVTPDSSLVDGQHVTVTGAGFFPNAPLGLSECASTTSVGTCAGGDSVEAGADGTFSTDVVVRAQLWAGQVLDCRNLPAAPTVDCSIQAFSFADQDLPTTVALHFDPNGELLPPPTLTATPDTDLVDGQTVSLTGSHIAYPYGPIFVTGKAVQPASARWVPPITPPKTNPVTADEPAPDPEAFRVEVFECASGSVDFQRCAPANTSAPVDADGNLTGEVTVWATFTTVDGQSIDCRTSATACELRAGYGNPLTTAVTPIAFDPDAPLAPAPTVSVTPTTGLVDQADLHVTGDGFPAYSWVSFHQCLADEVGLEGCDTDVYGGASADGNGHLDTVTRAKEVLSLGPSSNPTATTFDCGSSPNACRLLMTNSFGPAKWTSVTLDYAGSAPPPAAAPATEVAVSPSFTG